MDPFLCVICACFYALIAGASSMIAHENNYFENDSPNVRNLKYFIFCTLWPFVFTYGILYGLVVGSKYAVKFFISVGRGVVEVMPKRKPKLPKAIVLDNERKAG